MIVLGIDPGSRITGYGIIAAQGKNLRHIDNGGIAPKSTLTLPHRLHTIYTSMMKLIAEHAPDAIAIENIFVAHNVKSAMTLGHARGVAMLAAVTANVPILEYSATQVKQALVGNGAATKHQVQQMTRTVLKLPDIAHEDAADALAVAICHVQSFALTQRIERSLGA